MSRLWIFPRGMERYGVVGKNPVRWRSKYGSVVTSAYDICTTDGMNEKGLCANLLWQSESVYPKWDGVVDAISIAVWAQYMLDNFATVDEAVEAMNGGEFVVISDLMPNGSSPATLHLSISDVTGDSAIFEYVDGNLQIYYGRDYVVATNLPLYELQLALNAYWKPIGGEIFLPGANRATDRFVRASFYVNALPKTIDIEQAVAGVFSVIRNVSVPIGISRSDASSVASTRWRTVADQKNRVYYFDSVMRPSVFWVEFDDVDFTEGGRVRSLNPNDVEPYAGNVAAEFKVTKPFDFVGVAPRK